VAFLDQLNSRLASDGSKTAKKISGPIAGQVLNGNNGSLDVTARGSQRLAQMAPVWSMRVATSRYQVVLVC
jgi:hypothetical protein